ncbi:hypothetical protein BAU15_05425 [Enterococcus sp. JM4C]|uniref:LysM peptidoglycan-binding domain-containing protein n=1 Tax=Candidatus Enterococcus huntleyi TaxID=1857217 RepID=UPI00137959AC|nr:LysM domain-containing protein [Enterococcus sp. JM4C]KAF1295192.1 hypothetical protein BAU15_05425 [Enterococcus sp. JM4C]
MKKLGLGITVLSIMILGGCSSKENTINSSSSTSSSSTTKVSTTETSTTKPSEKINKTKKEVAPKASYQSILDEYTKKMQDESPKLVDEYNAEYPSIQGGINALAELSNKKVAKLAETSNEGVAKMAELQLNNKDDYSVYEEWAGKLIAVYSEEAQKIIDAYMASAAIETPEFSEPSYEEYTIEPPKQTEQSEYKIAESEPAPQGEEYTTVQAGENPDQIAARTGVPVETIYELNGMSPDSYFLSPGDSIRIK